MPHSIQFVTLILMLIFFFLLNNADFLMFGIINFALLNSAMMIAFIKIKTGKRFIPFIPLYLTVDVILFTITLAYVQTLGRFIHLTKEVWPSLQGRYYHVGSELRTEYFKAEQKVKKNFRQLELEVKREVKKGIKKHKIQSDFLRTR